MWLGKTEMLEGHSRLDGVQVIALGSIKSPRVWLDSGLSLDKQVFMVIQSAFFHLCQACLLAPYLSGSDPGTLIDSKVTCRLNY